MHTLNEHIERPFQMRTLRRSALVARIDLLQQLGQQVFEEARTLWTCWCNIARWDCCNSVARCKTTKASSVPASQSHEIAFVLQQFLCFSQRPCLFLVPVESSNTWLCGLESHTNCEECVVMFETISAQKSSHLLIYVFWCMFFKFVVVEDLIIKFLKMVSVDVFPSFAEA